MCKPPRWCRSKLDLLFHIIFIFPRRSCVLFHMSSDAHLSKLSQHQTLLQVMWIIVTWCGSQLSLLTHLPLYLHARLVFVLYSVDGCLLQLCSMKIFCSTPHVIPCFVSKSLQNLFISCFCLFTPDNLIFYDFRSSSFSLVTLFLLCFPR